MKHLQANLNTYTRSNLDLPTLTSPLPSGQPFAVARCPAEVSRALQRQTYYAVSYLGHIETCSLLPQDVLNPRNSRYYISPYFKSELEAVVFAFTHEHRLIFGLSDEFRAHWEPKLRDSHPELFL